MMRDEKCTLEEAKQVIEQKNEEFAKLKGDLKSVLIDKPALPVVEVADKNETDYYAF